MTSDVAGTSEDRGTSEDPAGGGGPSTERALVVMAHPDDVDFGAAGAIALWVRSGVQVSYCVVTDGDAGGQQPDVDARSLAEIRRAEQRAAAAVVGVSDVRFLGYPDGRLVEGLELRRDLTRVIRQVRPHRLLTHSPERNYRRIGASHPDHRVVGAAALDAVYPDARNRYAFPELFTEEGLAEWTVAEVWQRGGPTSNTYVDITEVLDLKIAAILAHHSQVGHRDGFGEVLAARLTAIGYEGGLPDGHSAESFHRFSTA